MRAFIVLSLVAVACADSLGYNYQPVGHSDGGLSFAPGAGGSGGLGGFGGSADLGGSRGGSGFGGSNGGLGGSGGGFGGLGGSGGQGGNGGFAAGPSSGFDNASPSYSAPADFNKEFFTYSADENEFNDPNANEQVANSLKQGLRVIFIKGPENKGLENAALALAKHASEDKTAIYVLNKQADIGDLANKLNSIRNQNSNKPEVHFVKYRTPEDAANAQNAIQGQYDSLGGSSQSHNGGVAPVLNFASQGPVRAPTAHAPGSAYLPTSIFRRRI